MYTAGWGHFESYFLIKQEAIFKIILLQNQLNNYKTEVGIANSYREA